MSWVSIDKDNCNDCGICVIRCIRCFAEKDDEIVVYADENNCNLCGHCVSLCPTDAIVHHKMNMDNFIDTDNKIKFDTDEFIQLVRRRRSHRSFKNKDVPLQDLESLVDLCRYAPTGSNRQTVEIIMIQDKKKIKRLSDLTVDFFKDMIDQVERQVEELKGAGKEIPEDLQYTYSNLVSRKRLVVARDLGIDPIFYKAPAVMIFHSPTLTSTPKDDCVIAAQTVVLTAMTMGLETCYIGLFEASARDYPPIGEELMLPPGNQVLSVLIMGYPRLTYLRTVDRKPIKVRWE